MFYLFVFDLVLVYEVSVNFFFLVDVLGGKFEWVLVLIIVLFMLWD